jgi:sodium transport system ATP-binding protein
MDMSDKIVSVEGLTKRFGQIMALDNVNFNLHKGDVVGLVGGNGAGKTTLLRILSGLYRPTNGSVAFHQEEGAVSPAHKMRHRFGVVPEATGLYHRLTAWENIRYHARLHGVSDEVAWSRVAMFADALNFTDSLSRHTRGFSKGMRQKTALLRALVHGPDILLLDEPTAGLDVTSARMVRKLVRKLKEEGGTVIYSTHNLAEAEQVCDRILIVHNGQLRADGTPGELISSVDGVNLEDAYVEMTSDSARQDYSNLEEGVISKFWKKLLTPTKKDPGGDESE